MNKNEQQPRQLTLDNERLEAAKQSLDQGAVTPEAEQWREAIIALLNDSLATEIVCVLRYKRHHFTATGLESPAIADEFLVHANEEQAHADKIAKR
ncbi:MAG: ferritin-like domain-containing protein, partial [Comamonas sp.]